MKCNSSHVLMLPAPYPNKYLYFSNLCPLRGFSTVLKSSHFSKASAVPKKMNTLCITIELFRWASHACKVLFLIRPVLKKPNPRCALVLHVYLGTVQAFDTCDHISKVIITLVKHLKCHGQGDTGLQQHCTIVNTFTEFCMDEYDAGH